MTAQSDPSRRAMRTDAAAFVAVLAVICLLWSASMAATDLRAMTDTGLVSVLGWSAYVALGALVVSFAVALTRRTAPAWVGGLHVAVLVLVVHATPALRYGTLRYSWAWKHVGIIDYIDRFGAVDPQIGQLGVYHNWPGFFGFSALLQQASGLDSALSFASWGPAWFNLLTAAAVALVVRALTDDRRLVLLATWLFVLGNWVGQGYFSPQALNVFWYLIVLALLLRWFRREPSPPGGARLQPLAAMAIIVVLLACIAGTHQLTPIATTLALGALVAFRQTSARWLPLLMIAMTLAWALFAAEPFVAGELSDALAAVGQVEDNASGGLVDYGQVSGGQVLVSLVARGLSAFVGVLAVLGGLRALRRGERNSAAVLLTLAPAGLLVVSGYGGEAAFRVFLFALPFLAFFAAKLLHIEPGPTRRWPQVALTSGVAGVMLAGLLVAYYGNERAYYFTPQEVAAARYVYENAPEGSLLVEGSRSYPTQFRNYERFTYVPIAREPWESRVSIVADPAARLGDWMSDDRYTAGYVLITRSQKADTAALGEMPPGGLERIEEALRGAPQFQLVYGSADASIFRYVEVEPAAVSRVSVGGVDG